MRAGNRSAFTLAALAPVLARLSAERPVPLLVLRLPQLERIAWRSGRRAAQRVEREASNAFVQCARTCLRDEDFLAHDGGSDVFVAVIAAAARERGNRLPTALDCRSALERIAAGMSAGTGLPVETGWTLVANADASEGLTPEIESALERGLRERERYEFFATVGHELRTPLTSIRGYLETVLDGGIDAATTRRFLETARRETLRLARLVENMFEFSLLDLSASACHAASCDVGGAVVAGCELAAAAAGARNITIVNSVAGGSRARIEEDACIQVIVNLLDNAVKYGRDGGCVRISLREDEPYLRIDVEDDGPGICAGDREAIFGLRIRAAQNGRPGTGIGLAIVRMIAERAGGEVCVSESTLGGARFELVLPLEAELAAATS